MHGLSPRTGGPGAAGHDRGRPPRPSAGSFPQTSSWTRRRRGSRGSTTVEQERDRGTGVLACARHVVARVTGRCPSSCEARGAPCGRAVARGPRLGADRPRGRLVVVARPRGPRIRSRQADAAAVLELAFGHLRAEAAVQLGRRRQRRLARRLTVASATGTPTRRSWPPVARRSSTSGSNGRRGRRSAAAPGPEAVSGVGAARAHCRSSGSGDERGLSARRRRPPRGIRSIWGGGRSTGSIPSRFTSQKRPRARSGVIPLGVWCNWQHYGFWFRHSRFESWYPSSVQRSFEPRSRFGEISPAR